jgi:hypothetical protein
MIVPGSYSGVGRAATHHHLLGRLLRDIVSLEGEKAAPSSSRPQETGGLP